VERLYSDSIINLPLKEAIENYQVKLTGKQNFFAYYLRKTIPMSFDAMTTSPVELVNNHLKHHGKVSYSHVRLNKGQYILLTTSAKNHQVSSKFNASKSLMMITEATNSRSDKIYLSSHREEQYSVISSKLTNKKLFTRKCVYIMNDMYDSRSAEHCARVAMDSWIVWNFHQDVLPTFDNDLLSLGKEFPMFRNVYRVLLKKKNTQHFMQCECLLYERCGIPCKHILRITDKIEDNMVKIQHWKVYATHFGDDSELSRKLMDARSLQQCNEGNGVPISNSLLLKCLSPPFG